MLRRIVKILLILVCLCLLVSGGVAGYYLLWKGHPPAKRPDLVRLPENAPPAPRGFPTMNALYAGYFLGLLELLDPAFDWPVPPEVVERKDIEYGRVGERPLLLDLYSPKEMKEPVPGLIFVHGGGWQEGNKSDYKFYTIDFAKRGYVAATMGYRFSQEAGFPGCVLDAKCAVRWMRSHAKEINVDPDRIVIIGGSAGGYLAMMTGYTSGVQEWNESGGYPGVSSAVAAVVDLYGPPDLTGPVARTHYIVTDFMKKPYEEAPELYAAASPLLHLTKDAPPTLVIQGTIDDIVPVQYSDQLVERLKELGVPYWYARLDGWPHTMDVERSVNTYVQWIMNAFFDAYLKK